MAHARLVGLGALVGIPAAAVAALFLGLVHDLSTGSGRTSPTRSASRVPRGTWCWGCRSGAHPGRLARTLLPGDGGHTPLHGIDARPRRSPSARHCASRAGTLGFGAVLGPEAPVVALGSIVAVALTRSPGSPKTTPRCSATAGAFAAISALFGGPIVAGVMMLESAAPTLGRDVGTGASAWLRRGRDRLRDLRRLRQLGRARHGRPSPVPNLPLYDGTRVRRSLLRRRDRSGHRHRDRGRDPVRDPTRSRAG